MTEQYRNNYFKLVAVIVEIAYMVIRKYIREKILAPDSFVTFLNKKKHTLVHIHETSKCCECMKKYIRGERLISRKQLLILYKLDDKNQIHDHRKYVEAKSTQICICKYSAKENIDVGVLDITLGNFIIQKFGEQELGIANWIEQIKDVRNEIFHLSDIQEMTDQMFSRKWSKLEGSIIGIAKAIGKAYAVETEQNIMQKKKLTIVGDYMLKYEIICRDYWRNKCAEFERAQHKVIEEKSKALHHAMPQLFRRSMEKDCQKTMKNIKTFNTMVDNINLMISIFDIEENLGNCNATEQVDENMKRIFIPVFMQLDIPNSWDKTKVFEAVDELRLNGTPDMNIRITAVSSDDLNIYADIANKVLSKVHILSSEINKIMSTILSEAEISTTEHAKFGVNLKIQDRSEIEFDTEEAITQNQTCAKNNRPVSVNLHEQLNIKKSWKENLNIFSCIKAGYKLVFTDDEQERLIICNVECTDIVYIPLSFGPWFMTLVNSNTVAVSFKLYQSILILDVSTGSFTSKINIGGRCSGISYNDNNLYVVIYERIIHVMDLTGQVVRTIPLPSRHIRDITVDRDRLVCINDTSIYCCSLDGKLFWKFKKDKYQDLCRVTTDDEGHVYVTNGLNNTVVVVSDNGMNYSELFTKSDGLYMPYGIYFERIEKVLLVCNFDDGKVFLFDMKKNQHKLP